MIKHYNRGRIFAFGVVYFFLVLPVLYGWIALMIDFFRGDLILFVDNRNLVIYTIVILILGNLNSHIFMESRFSISLDHNTLRYKSYLGRSIVITSNQIKRIIVCPETLSFKRGYESIIIIRKGFRRSLFFIEYSMKKESYQYMKTMIFDFCDSCMIKQYKKGYVKQILLFLLY